MAGADSTATAVRIIMYLVMTNPLVYAKLRAELDEADRKILLSWPVLTNAQAMSLPYLQAVITQGLRPWPPGVGISTKWVPPESDTLEDGRFISGGTRIDGRHGARNTTKRYMVTMPITSGQRGGSNQSRAARLY
jgi:hypothetical protein